MAATRPKVSGDRSGRWRGEAADAADRRPGQARGSVRRHLPPDRLRAVQPGQRGHAADRGADPVQVALPGPAHLADLADVDPAGELRDPGAGAAAAGPALVPGQRRRDLPVAEPDQGRGPRLRGGVRGGQHLPDGRLADAGRAHRRGAGLHRGRHPGAAQPGQRVRRDRRRRRQQDRRLPGEAGRPAGAGRRPGVLVRLDGQLHLHQRRADRRAAQRRGERQLPARHGRGHHPQLRGAGRGPGL